MALVILLIGYTVSMLWAFYKGLKFQSSDKNLGIISLMYSKHMSISKYNKYFTFS